MALLNLTMMDIFTPKLVLEGEFQTSQNVRRKGSGCQPVVKACRPLKHVAGAIVQWSGLGGLHSQAKK